MRQLFTDESKKDPKKLSEETIELFLTFVNNLINSAIGERLMQTDIIKAYDAKIVSVLSGGSSATLLCDDNYYTAKNCTGIAFTSGDVGRWVKMISCDGINYFILHKHEPEVINIEALKQDIIEAVLERLKSSE